MTTTEINHDYHASPDCYACDGRGHLTETIYNTDGHEEQITELCSMCGGTQVAW